MAYTKTQWVNNTTPIDETNLNKMEQGIYDNSLVADAVKDTINPTDTEIYKTAELTEGQITDVIAVSDIVIKGQTSQNGEPTPSSPVDVNVVSGSNVINTSNKNLLNINNAIAFRACTIQLQNNSIKIITDGTTNAIVRIPCVLTAGNYYLHFEGNTNIVNVAFYNSNGEKIIANNPSSSKAITLSDNLAYIHINLSNVAGTYTLAFNKLYINLGSTDLSYEPHQGKELPLDLPVENLFNGTNLTEQNTYLCPCRIGDIFTFSFKGLANTNGQRVFLRTYDGDFSSSLDSSVNQSIAYLTTTEDYYTLTITSTINGFLYVRTAAVIVSYTLSNIQLEKGSKANAYTPYGTDPIELCKIGDYQDYFYKSGSKWYLHKETLKIIIPSSVNGTMQNSNKRFFVNKTQIGNYDILNTSSSSQTFGLYCDILKEVTAGQTWSGTQGISYDYNASSGTVGFDFSINGLTTVAEYQEALEGKIIVARLNTPTNTEITDTTLISQLEAIYNAPLYEQTNITQTNNDLPMVLDITACKDNINGIKAFIRK